MAKYINRDEAIQLLRNYGLTPQDPRLKNIIIYRKPTATELASDGMAGVSLLSALQDNSFGLVNEDTLRQILDNRSQKAFREQNSIPVVDNNIYDGGTTNQEFEIVGTPNKSKKTSVLDQNIQNDLAEINQNPGQLKISPFMRNVVLPVGDAVNQAVDVILPDDLQKMANDQTLAMQRVYDNPISRKLYQDTFLSASNDVGNAAAAVFMAPTIAAGIGSLATIPGWVGLASGYAGHEAGDYLINKWSDGKYNGWADMIGQWSNGYIYPLTSEIYNPFTAASSLTGQYLAQEVPVGIANQRAAMQNGEILGTEYPKGVAKMGSDAYVEQVLTTPNTAVPKTWYSGMGVQTNPMVGRPALPKGQRFGSTYQEQVTNPKKGKSKGNTNRAHRTGDSEKRSRVSYSPRAEHIPTRDQEIAMLAPKAPVGDYFSTLPEGYIPIFNMPPQTPPAAPPVTPSPAPQPETREEVITVIKDPFEKWFEINYGENPGGVAYWPGHEDSAIPAGDKKLILGKKGTKKRTKRQVAVGKNDPYKRPYGAEAIDSVSTRPYAGEAERVTTLQGGVPPEASIGEVIVNRNGGRLIPRNKKF